MKKTIVLLGLIFILQSCNQTITDKDIANLNGYWEIKKVVLNDGDDKDYKVNETIDFFEVKDNKGFRQKVMPQFDGTFKTNNLKEEIFISNSDGNYFINYSTEYGKWKEEIIEIKDSVLVTKNDKELRVSL